MTQVEILNHTPRVGPDTELDRAHWRLIANAWREKTPLKEPPSDRNSLQRIARAHGPDMFMIHYDENRIFVTFWIDGDEHWFVYAEPCWNTDDWPKIPATS